MTDLTTTLAAIPAPHAGPRPDPETWAGARADWEGGWSAPVVAERYGLGERNVRRRAAAEGWQRRGAGAEAAGAAGALGELRARLALALAAEPASGDVERDDDEHLHQVVEQHELEVGRLLLRPTPETLTAFAFRRAAECSARAAPVETLSWLKVVAALDRSRATLTRAARPHTGADYERAAFARMLQQLLDNETPDEGRAYHDLVEEMIAAPDDDGDAIA